MPGIWSKRIRIIEKIEKIYEYINPYLFYISIIATIVFVLCNIKRLKEIYEECIILLAVSSLYASRIFIITFTKEMMFEEALNTSYLACIYDIQYLFGIIAILFLIKDFRSKYNKRNRINYIDSNIE